MSYDQVISQVVKVVEAVGAGIMVLGGLAAFLVFASRALRPETARESYGELRRTLGRCILVGLEVLIIADIVRTIIVAPTLESVAVLGIIVVIRIALSFSLEGGLEQGRRALRDDCDRHSSTAPRLRIGRIWSASSDDRPVRIGRSPTTSASTDRNSVVGDSIAPSATSTSSVSTEVIGPMLRVEQSPTGFQRWLSRGGVRTPGPPATSSDLLGLAEDHEAVDADQADGKDAERPPGVRAADVQQRADRPPRSRSGAHRYRQRTARTRR